jgi:Leucine-rich repeat (LRR) protein
MKKYIMLVVVTVLLIGFGILVLQLNNTGYSPRESTNYANSGVTEFPKTVFGNSDIEELDLSNNNLKGALPAEIRQLKKLRKLDVSDNQMTGIPAEIGQLEMLEELDYSNNQLTGLPLELGNLKRIRKINFSGNENLSQFDLSKIREALPKEVIIITD